MALLRLRGVYNPTHYYVRVSRGGKLHRHWAFFTGTGLASYRQMRAPPCATLDPTDDDQKPGRRQWGKGDTNGSPNDHGSSAGSRPWGTSPAEGLPPGDALLRVAQGGVRLPTPLQKNQCAPPGGREAIELGPLVVVVT